MSETLSRGAPPAEPAAEDPPVRMVRDAQGRLLAIPMDMAIPDGAVPVKGFAGGSPPPAPPADDPPVRMVRDAQGRLLAIPMDMAIPEGAVPVKGFAGASAPPPPSAPPAEDPPVRMVRDAQGRLLAIPVDMAIPDGAVPVKGFAGGSPPPAPPSDDPPVRMVRDAQGRLLAIPVDMEIPDGAVPVNAFAADGPPIAGAAPGRGVRASIGDSAGLMSAQRAAVVGGIAPAPGVLSAVPDLAPPAARPGLSRGTAAEPLIEPRSEELQEVVSFVPHWLVRWGTMVVFAVVALMLAITWLVHYPGLVAGRATLTTPQPPVRLVAQTAGEVESLFAADGQQVRRGDVLGVLRNPADYQAVTRVAAALERFDAADPARMEAAFAREPALGDIQGPYTAFLEALADLRAFEAAPYDREKMGGLQGQIESQRRLSDNLGGQQALIREQLAMAERDRERNRELARRELISSQELEKAEAEYLQKRLALENARNALTSSDIQIAGQGNSLLEMRQRHEDLRRQYVQALRGAADALHAAVERWRQQYLWVAPIGGRVSFFRPLARGQYVPGSEPVLALVPNGGRAIARVLVPQNVSGKVRVGQKVIIRFDGFPAGEFGTVTGRVEKISLVPDEKKEDEPRYMLEAALPNGLVTSYGKPLPFRQEMRGDADVVTDDVRLFHRIFHQFFSLLATAREGQGGTAAAGE